jgi:hypothetical protein
VLYVILLASTSSLGFRSNRDVTAVTAATATAVRINTGAVKATAATASTGAAAANAEGKSTIDSAEMRAFEHLLPRRIVVTKQFLQVRDFAFLLSIIT